MATILAPACGEAAGEAAGEGEAAAAGEATAAGERDAAGDAAVAGFGTSVALAAGAAVGAGVAAGVHAVTVRVNTTADENDQTTRRAFNATHLREQMATGARRRRSG